MSIIAAGTSSGTALVSTGDTNGTLVIQTNGTTVAATFGTDQSVNIGVASGNGTVNVQSPSNGIALQINGRTSDNSGEMRFYSNGGSTHYATCSATAAQVSIIANNSNVMSFLVGGSERVRIDTSGNFQFDSGYGTYATAYGCRAWVNFNGTGTVAIRASGNVSSITDNGAGDYTVNFTTAIVDANYSVSIAAASSTIGNNLCTRISGTTVSTSNVRLLTASGGGGALADCETVAVSVFR